MRPADFESVLVAGSWLVCRTKICRLLPLVLFVNSYRLAHRKCHPVSGDGPKLLPLVQRRRGRASWRDVCVACMPDSLSTLSDTRKIIVALIELRGEVIS